MCGLHGHGGATFHNQGGPYGRTKGAKHTIAVDITGLPAAAVVVPAGTDDGAAVERLVEANPLGSRLELLIVDRGVKAGAQRRLVASRGVRVNRVGWDEPQLDDNGRRVFRPIPCAWRVEVAHALVGRHRRLAKSFENTVSSATAWVQVSCAALLLRHLAE